MNIDQAFDLSYKSHWWDHKLVYFVVDFDCSQPKVKIGCTNNVGRRLKALQVGSSSILQLYGVIDGSKWEECFLHRFFKKQKSHGEWFIFDRCKMNIDDLLQFENVNSWVDERRHHSACDMA